MPTYWVKLKTIEEIDFGIINTTNEKEAFEKAKEKLSAIFGQDTPLEEIKRKIKFGGVDGLQLFENNDWNIENSLSKKD